MPGVVVTDVFRRLPKPEWGEGFGMKLKFASALLAESALFISAAAAFAQEPAAAPQPDEQEVTEPDQSGAPAGAQLANAQAVDDARTKIELLEAQVDALQSAIEQIKSQMVKATPTWKGAPQWEDKEAGWSFKPKGLVQWDAGYVGFPRGNELRGTVGGLNFGNLGWDSRARRLNIGADGTIPGGFRYSAEFNFAQGTVDYEDIWLAYDLKNSPLTFQAGHFYPFSSLDTMTSSKYTSFLERAGLTDAFSYNRRLGVALLVNDKKADAWTFQAGIFNQPINDTSFNRTGWQASVRAVYSPTLGDTRLHLGANFQHRQNTREALAQQYRARPTTQLTDQRFIDTGNLAAKGDDIVGLELAAIHKSLHFAAEAARLRVRHAYDAAEIAALNGQTDTNDTIPTGAVALNGNPSFSAGYAEVGYYFTGETRGYKGGRFDRTKVLHSFNEGGWGALQLNGRIDYVELRDRVDSSSSSVAAPFYVNGGKQIAYQASLIWNPTDYVRLMAQYGHIDVTGGPRASVATIGPPPTPGIFPIGTDTPANKRNYGVDTFAVRAQVDF
jgi:phosphate-selective porin OprO/OprP